VPGPERFAGRWFGPDGRTLEIAGREAMVVRSGGVERPLVAAGASGLLTDHPGLAPYLLVLESGDVPLLRLGSMLFGRDAAPPQPVPDPRLASLAGRYANPGGWGSPLVVHAVGDRLMFGDEQVFEEADGSWRSRRPIPSPERIWFQDVVDGKPRTLNFSGSRFARLSD
jgi:hypothetical protein